MTAIPYAEVIGDPIDHSLSPVIHCFWLKQLGIRSGYRRYRLNRSELGAYLDDRRKDSNWRGCNVTMPLKLDAIALADEASDRALGAGAANQLLPRAGKLLAGNTDVGAVATLVRRLADNGAPMASVTLLGTGGAARAALLALHLLGINRVRIQARDRGEAFKLAVEFDLAFEPAGFEAAVESDGLINATPLGMAGQPPLDIALDAMPANGWVFDFISSPNPTALVTRAAERGMKTVGGIAMLVEQAAESFYHLFGAAAPRDKDAELMARLAK